MWHKNQARHAHFHFELKTAGIPSVLQLEKCLENKKSAKLKNNLGHFLNFGSIFNSFRNIPPNAIFTVKVRTPVGNFKTQWDKIAHWNPNLHSKNCVWWIILKNVQDRAKILKNDPIISNFSTFFVFEHFSENRRGELDFYATTRFFSKIIHLF